MAAAVVTLVVLWLHLADLHLPLPEGDDQVSRLAFAARWLLLPALALFAGIVLVANQRFFVADAIDGARTSQSRLTLIPAMAIVFIAGRALFWIGYLIAPVARALGMGLSAYPTFAALIWLASRMFP
jgi:hypothetical protein